MRKKKQIKQQIKQRNPMHQTWETEMCKFNDAILQKTNLMILSETLVPGSSENFPTPSTFQMM